MSEASHGSQTPSAVTQHLLGESSSSRVIQALYDLGPSSRADLARATGLSRGSLTGIVQRMLEQSLLEEGPPRASSAVGGKPSRPLWFSQSGPMIAAAHLLPDEVHTALVSLSGDVIVKRTAPFDPAVENPSDAVSELIHAQLDSMRDVTEGPVLGIGIAVGGMVDTDSGRVVRIDLARPLDGMPLASLVTRMTGLPTVIDLHPRAQALGDRWFGLGRGRSSFASVYAAEALGVGLVLNGVLQRGPAGSGGEIGHSIVQFDGIECLCGQRGCWETIASERWLVGEACRLQLPSPATMTAGRLVTLAQEGDARAEALLEDYARNLSVGLVNLHQILAPGLFILHGSAASGGEAFLDRIRRHFAVRVPQHPSASPSIIQSDDHDSVTLVGAAALVLSSIID